MFKPSTLNLLAQLARGIARQFGNNCEIVVHDLSRRSIDNSIVIIENGHVTSRKVGDGPSHVVLEALKETPARLDDHLNYLTRTQDGRILKSSTIYVRDDAGEVAGIFSINYDITSLLAVEGALQSLISVEKPELQTPEKIPRNVNDLLDELIEQSVRNVGKPAALMSKEEKIKAIHFLNDSGAFLVTKSGDKVAKYFGISKYTLYSYIDAKR